MKATEIGLIVARARTRAGLTQAELGERMGTTQSAIARIEAGRTTPSLQVLERISNATGEPIVLRFGPAAKTLTRTQRKARVRKLRGDFRFDPYSRSPSSAEVKSLESDGITRR